MDVSSKERENTVMLVGMRNTRMCVFIDEIQMNVGEC